MPVSRADHLATPSTEPSSYDASTPREARSQSRIPSLDGLRALSILLVLVGHLDDTRGFPFSGHPLFVLADWANIGVRVFFVISGFLITGLLLGEIEREGRIHLGRFYVRRTLRIFPAYYALIAATVIAGTFGIAQLERGDVLAAASYTMNYHQARGWSLGHAWSLAVEEQFYLLWPATLVVFGVRRGLQIAAAFVLLGPVIRIGLLIPEGGVAGIGMRFETIGDAIAAGCLLAGFRERLWNWPLYRRFVESRWIALLPVMIAAIAILPTLEAARAFGIERVYIGAYQSGGLLLTNLAIAVCIGWAIRHSERGFGRVLNWKPLVYIGTISYSLYLWQEPFMRGLDRPWTHFPLNVVFIFGFALASFYLIEKPALRARRTLERRWNARIATAAGAAA